MIPEPPDTAIGTALILVAIAIGVVVLIEFFAR
jgi:hypothetical protein